MKVSALFRLRSQFGLYGESGRCCFWWTVHRSVSQSNVRYTRREYRYSRFPQIMFTRFKPILAILSLVSFSGGMSSAVLSHHASHNPQMSPGASVANIKTEAHHHGSGSSAGSPGEPGSKSTTSLKWKIKGGIGGGRGRVMEESERGG